MWRKPRLLARVLLFAGLMLAAVVGAPAGAVTLTEGTGPGPLAVRTAEYKLAAAKDPAVAADTVTELWARVYHPVPIAGAAPRPLLVFLHGNHATCGRFDAGLGVRVDDDVTYTDTGTCPAGYVVTPNHNGYGYVARRLASWGYVVVSINANRGINGAWGDDDDFGLNLRRGRLVLRHLQQLARWNTLGGAPQSLGVDLKGRLDFSQVGLMGHSRGGEGMRAAIAQYGDDGSPWPGRIGPVTFRALYEIAPVDGQTSRTLDADGVPWNVLLPQCDGDVSSLDGIRPFDRMLAKPQDPSLTPKSTYFVWGANHNFYNTEWLLSDSYGCVGATALFGAAGTSTRQQETSLRSMTAFFRAHVGNDRIPKLAVLHNPDVRVPDFLRDVTPIDRGYIDTSDSSISRRLEEFDRATGRNTYGFVNLAAGIGIEHAGIAEHDYAQRAAAISWDSRSGGSSGNITPYFQTNWAAPGRGLDIRPWRTLEFRVSRQCGDIDYCYEPSPLSPPGNLDMSLALVRADGTLTRSVNLSSYALLRPLGGTDWGLHPTLRTVRVPLSVFGGAAQERFRGLRFNFNRTAYGAIHLANVRLSKLRGSLPGSSGSAVAGTPAPAAATLGAGTASAPVKVAGNRIIAVRPAGGSDGRLAAAAGGDVEIVLGTRQKLPVIDALPLLLIGEVPVRRLRLAREGAETTLTFVLTAEQYAAAPDGAEVVLQHGVRQRWSFGTLDK